MSKQTDLINVTDAITVSGSNNVGIGTSTTDSYYAKDLVISSADEGGVTIVGATGHQNYLMFADGTSGGERFRGYIGYDHDGDLMQITSGGDTKFLVNDTSEAMRIDSSGRVGIGATSLGAGKGLTVANGAISVTSANLSHSTSSLVLSQNDSSLSQIRFYGANTSTAGILQFDGSSSNGTVGGERMRIDSSGNLLVGTTNANIYSTTTTGINLNPNGPTSFNRNGGQAAMFNRINSDGDIVQFRKDGTTVGSIGNNSGGLYIGSGDAGVTMESTLDAIIPTNASTGSYTDNALDIGYSSKRFKDAYLSGGVYLGGTGSANKLDDYEEGSFTPDISFTGVNAETYSRQLGSYVKVGKFVFCSIAIIFQKNTSTGVFGIGGFPFQCNGTATQDRGAASFGYWAGLSNGYYTPLFLMDDGNNFGYVRIGGTGTASSNGNTSLDANNIGSEVNFHFSVTYRTNS